MKQTCRDEILEAIRSILSRSGRDSFELDEVIREMSARGTSYSESTIRTHVGSRMCVNAPDHHAVVHQDLVRLDRGVYRLAE